MSLAAVAREPHDHGHTRAFREMVGWLAMRRSEAAVVELSRSRSAYRRRDRRPDARAARDPVEGLTRIGSMICRSSRHKYLRMVMVEPLPAELPEGEHITKDALAKVLAAITIGCDQRSGPHDVGSATPTPADQARSAPPSGSGRGGPSAGGRLSASRAAIAVRRPSTRYASKSRSPKS